MAKQVAQDTDQSWSKQAGDAIAAAVAASSCASKIATVAAQSVTQGVASATMTAWEKVEPSAQAILEQGTTTVGEFVTPIAEHPVVKFFGKAPVLNRLYAALGQVDIEKAVTDVANLQQRYPTEAPEQLAHRIMVDTALKAGGVGLLTNIVPIAALTLFAVDIAAVTSLQAEMVYRIAGVYGFPLQEPSRRGEVLAIFGLSVGGSSALKAGLSFAEMIPLVGPAVGASNNAGLIYSLGYLACRYYESKRKSTHPSEKL